MHMTTIHRHAKPHVRLMLTFMGKPKHEQRRLKREARRMAVQNYPQLVKAVAARDGRKCRECGATTDLVLDHIHPVSKGGKTEVRNLQFLCRTHDRLKANRLR